MVVIIELIRNWKSERPSFISLKSRLIISSIYFILWTSPEINLVGAPPSASDWIPSNLYVPQVNEYERTNLYIYTSSIFHFMITNKNFKTKKSTCILVSLKRRKIFYFFNKLRPPCISDTANTLGLLCVAAYLVLFKI